MSVSYCWAFKFGLPETWNTNPESHVHSSTVLHESLRCQSVLPLQNLRTAGRRFQQASANRGHQPELHMGGFDIMSNVKIICQQAFIARAAGFIMLARLTTCYHWRQFFAKQLDLSQFRKYCTIPPGSALIQGQRELRPSHAASGSLCSHRQPGCSFRLSGLIICISCWLLILAKSTQSTDDMKPWIGAVQLLRIWVSAHAWHHSQFLKYIIKSMQVISILLWHWYEAKKRLLSHL